MNAVGRLRRGLATLGTLRVRLTLWYVLLLGVILLAFSVFLYASLARNLRDGVDRALGDHAQRVVDAIEVQDGRVELGDAPDDPPAGTVTAVYGPTGQQVLAAGSSRPPPSLLAALAAVPRGERVVLTVSAAGEEWRVLTVPVARRGSVAAVVQVARSEEEVAAALRGLLAVMGVAVPLTLLVAVAGGLFLAGRALGPIDRITRAAAGIGAEDLGQRLGFGGRDDEVGRLAATFDGMLDRLERAFQRQRQFTADASHELRTPLALLSTQAEVALARPRSAAEYRRVLASVYEDARRMSQLVSELLVLARADAGQDVVVCEPLDLGDLVAQVVAAMAPLAQARGVRLPAASVVPATIAGDQTRLTQLFVNLLDNALTYTPAGGDVTVSVAVEEGTIIVSVADTGVGIGPEHLPRVFERFYRADPARERRQGGAGLGLAISRWTARAHGGDISATSKVGRGTTFTVRLPLAPNGPSAA